MYRDPYRGFKVYRQGADYYEVQPQRNSLRIPKWYTAYRQPSGDWYVTNHFGRVLKNGSSLQAKIAAACEFQYSGREATN